VPRTQILRWREDADAPPRASSASASSSRACAARSTQLAPGLPVARPTKASVAAAAARPSRAAAPAPATARIVSGSRAGQEATVLRTGNGWVRLQLADGSQANVRSYDLELPNSPAEPLKGRGLTSTRTPPLAAAPAACFSRVRLRLRGVSAGRQLAHSRPSRRQQHKPPLRRDAALSRANLSALAEALSSSGSSSCGAR
jgi:hypothetical protein